MEETDDAAVGSQVVMETDQVVMETAETTDPYEYIQRKEFTSEIFKVEIENLPRNYGFAQLKKRLSTALKLNPHKLKAMPRTNFAFVTFKNMADRDDALSRIEGHVWKGKVLHVKKANPAADPLLKKRKQLEDDQQDQDVKKVKLDDEDTTPPAIRLLKSVSPYWEVPYEEQLKRKQQSVSEVLRSLATNGQTKDKLHTQRKSNNGMCCPLSDILPSPVLEAYRNKSEFSIGRSADGKDTVVGFRFGLYKDGHCSVGPPSNVTIIPQAMKKVVQCFQQYLEVSPHPAVFNPENHSGHWHQLTVRTTLRADVMAVAEFHPQQLSREELDTEKEAIQKFFTDGEGKSSGITSLYFHQSKARATHEQNKEPYELVLGQTHIYEEVLGLKFRISPDAFFQVNTRASEVLYRQIAEWCKLTPSTTVLDICCGTGTIGLTMAKKVERVVGIEMCKQAIEDAQENAKLNDITNVKYYCAKAEDVISHIMSSLWSKDVVAVVDPPRAGLHKKVIKCLRGCQKIKRLIYVSCNAKSAMPNFIDLIRKESKKHRGDGFLPVKAIPVDLFPQTPHCELVVLFQREIVDEEPVSTPTTVSSTVPSVQQSADSADSSLQDVTVKKTPAEGDVHDASSQNEVQDLTNPTSVDCGEQKALGVTSNQDVPGTGEVPGVTSNQDVPGTGEVQGVTINQDVPGTGEVQGVMSNQDVPGTGEVPGDTSNQDVLGT